MMDQVSWQNPRVLRLLVLVFVAGGLSGACAFRMWRIMVHRDHPVSILMNLDNKQSSLEILQRELALTPEQTRQVAAIIDDYKRYYGNIQDQFEEVRATGKNKIVQVLDAGQRAKFEKLAAPAK
jgi:Spy/CpxP family protein refolding chaperone